MSSEVNSTPTINRPWEGLAGLTSTPNAENWHHHLRAGFDLETTGPEPRDARIVTASLVLVDGIDGDIVQSYEWLVNPGIEIPEGAAAVHGVTTEKARAEGMNPGEAVEQLNLALGELMTAGVPVVAFNAPYDFTVLDRESGRHGLEPITPGLVVDPFVMDKAVDRYRKGKRTLTVVSAHYGVELLDAHTSAADSLAAVLVAGAIANRNRAWSKPVIELQQPLRSHKLTQSASLQEYLRKNDPAAVVDGSWPVIPRD